MKSRKEVSALLLTAFLFCCFAANAQETGSVRGFVVEMEKPVEFVNVILYSAADTAKPFKLTVTDSTGRFQMGNVPYGDYILKMQMLGYLPIRQNVIVNSSDLNIGRVLIESDSKLLDAVVVSTHKDVIKKTTSGFVMEAKNNLVQAGGTATDLLRNMPTVVVDADGNISVRGKSPMILINGRNSILSATDRIPASSVESIEIINNPGAQYDADADGGIISIKLKKSTAKGTNGSAVLGAGYGAHPRANSAFMLNHSSGKWNLGLAYDNRFAGRTRKAEADRTSFNIPSEYYLLQNRRDYRLEQTQNLKFNVDFNPNEKNSFGFELIGNMQGEDNDETLTSLIKTQTDSFNSKNTRESIEIVREKAAEAAFTYNRKFDDKRKKLAVILSSSSNFDTENTNITTQSLNSDDSNLGSAYLQRTHNYQTSNVSNFRIDFSQPVGKRGTFETGYKGITRYSDDDYKSGYVANDIFYANTAISNVFHFREQVHAAYIQFRSYTGKPDSAKFKYDVGLRAEQVYNHGYVDNNNLSFDRDYFNLFPTANLAYFLNEGDFFKLSFSRRINRPGLGQLNPFIDITDSLNQHGGNPNLKPELINSLEGGFNKEWKKVSLSTIVFYRYATNIIRPYIFLQPNGVALTIPTNFGSSTTYGFEGIASVFPVKWWSANLSFSVYQQLIDGSNVSADLANNVLSYYGKFINNFTMWKGSKLQLIANYNSPIATPQGTRVAVYNVDLGFQQKIMKGKGALGLVVTDIFNTQMSGLNAYANDFSYHRRFKVDTRAVLVTFAYSFGTKFKEELLENKFSND
ncbi:MAG: TonB-dependent receptor domain-containing protein [Bacteroidia bacterium]